MPLNEVEAYLADESTVKTSNQAYGSFKSMKKIAKEKEDEEMKMEVQTVQPIVKKANPLLQDKIYKSLLESVIVIEDFT
jgi:hypothetical protein